MHAFTSPSPSNASHWSLCSDWLGTEALHHRESPKCTAIWMFQATDRTISLYITSITSKMRPDALLRTEILHCSATSDKLRCIFCDLRIVFSPSMLNNDDSFMGVMISYLWNGVYGQSGTGTGFSQSTWFPTSVVITAMRHSLVIHVTSWLQSSVTDNAAQYVQVNCRRIRGRGGASSWGTALQAWRSRVWFPMLSLEFFIDIILLAALWLWGRLSP